MNYQTIVAAFDTPANAQAAVEALKAGGFHADDISSFDKSGSACVNPDYGTACPVAGWLNTKLWIQACWWRKATAAPVRLPAMTRWKAASAIVGSSTGS